MDTLSLDPRGGGWRRLSPMKVARHAHGLVEISGKLYAFGGCADAAQRSVEVNDPAADTWAWCLLDSKLEFPCNWSGYCAVL